MTAHGREDLKSQVSPSHLFQFLAPSLESPHFRKQLQTTVAIHFSALAAKPETEEKVIVAFE
jgi:hypothetical protein